MLTCDGRFAKDELISGNVRVAVRATALLLRGLPFGIEHTLWRSKSDRVSDRIRH